MQTSWYELILRFSGAAKFILNRKQKKIQSHVLRRPFQSKFIEHENAKKFQICVEPEGKAWLNWARH